MGPKNSPNSTPKNMAATAEPTTNGQIRRTPANRGSRPARNSSPPASSTAPWPASANIIPNITMNARPASTVGSTSAYGTVA